jgi:hypothetical protein
MTSHRCAFKKTKAYYMPYGQRVDPSEEFHPPNLRNLNRADLGQYYTKRALRVHDARLCKVFAFRA